MFRRVKRAHSGQVLPSTHPARQFPYVISPIVANIRLFFTVRDFRWWFRSERLRECQWHTFRDFPYTMASALQQALQRNYHQEGVNRPVETRLEAIKSSLNHVSMYLGLVAYTALGAKVIKPYDYLGQKGLKTEGIIFDNLKNLT